MLVEILVLVLSYLIGGIPFGYIITRFAGGVDIRDIGSGNIGTTNVYRALGLGWALATFFCDVVKGFLPVFFMSLASTSPWLVSLAGLLAVAGHMFSPFLKLRGGKGVATAFGAVLYLVPAAAAIDFAFWAALAFPFKIISAASLAAALGLPVLVFIFTPIWAYRLLSILLALMVLLSHRENIIRLAKGQEKKISRQDGEKEDK